MFRLYLFNIYVFSLVLLYIVRFLISLASHAHDNYDIPPLWLPQQLVNRDVFSAGSIPFYFTIGNNDRSRVLCGKFNYNRRAVKK